VIRNGTRIGGAAVAIVGTVGAGLCLRIGENSLALHAGDAAFRVDLTPNLPQFTLGEGLRRRVAK